MNKYIRINNIVGNVGLITNGDILVNVSKKDGSECVFFGEMDETGSMDIGPVDAGDYIVTMIDLWTQSFKKEDREKEITVT